MNPLDLIPRWVLLTATAVLLILTVNLKFNNLTLSLKVEKNASRIAELHAGIASAQALSAEAGRAMAETARNAQVAAAARERILAADLARANDNLDGLRVAVSQAKRGFGLRPDKVTPGADLDYADPFPDLFLQCSERYIRMAALADGHLSDALTLEASWPTDLSSKIESPP